MKCFKRFLPLSHFLYILYHKNFLKQRNAITRKFLDNLNNLNGFRGRHQTVKIHVQEELHTHIFSRGAGVQEHDKPPDSRKSIGGMVSRFFISAFQCWLFPGIFPTADKSRGTRMFTAETGEIHPKTAARFVNR